MTGRVSIIARRSDGLSAARERVRGGVVDHLVLLKPRVMSLVVFTGAVGFALAPAHIDWLRLVATLSAMAAGAGACGALNMWWDADIDANMARTAMRPIPRGAVPAREALAIGALLSIVSVAALGVRVNWLAASLLALTIAIYIPLYTMVLKRRTPLNIVIGGAAGALPPVIGWAAATNSLSVGPIALFLVTFLWTPPHFWALALVKSGDYARAGVPMLPVVAGEAETRRQILLYTFLLAPLGVAPWLLGYAGPLYGVVAVATGAALIALALRVRAERQGYAASKQMFGFSILYLFLLFAMLLADRLSGGLFGHFAV